MLYRAQQRALRSIRALNPPANGAQTWYSVICFLHRYVQPADQDKLPTGRAPEMPPQECRLTLAADYIHILLDPYEQQDLLLKLYDKLNGGWCPCVIGRRLPASL